VRRLVEKFPLLIRDVRPEDLANVIALQQVAFKHPWSPELLKRELTHDWSTLLVAAGEMDGCEQLLGFAIFWLVHDELHILNVATHPRARRQGVGRALMHETLIRARKRPCTLATLEVRRTNDAAISLYRSLGFRTVGVRPNYYVDEQEDALVMVLDL
jgi:[ribosomal protein S18]-alanine N-acetyltransferase